MKMHPIRTGFLVALLIAIALAAWVLLSTLWEIRYESTDCDVVPVGRSTGSVALHAASLDRYVQQHFPEDCSGKALTRLQFHGHFAGTALAAGEIELQYYRYVDDSRAGGNIEATTFHFDVVREELVTITRESGSGRALLGVYSEPVLQSVMEAPLELYIAHLDALVEVRQDAQTRMSIDLSHGGLRAKVFCEDTAHGYTYCETVKEWPPGTPFEKRKYTRVFES